MRRSILSKIIKYIIIGLVQGVSEILPISSSAHLIICEELLNIKSQGIFLEVFLHFASLLAIIIYERKEIIFLIKGFFKYIFGKKAYKKQFLFVIYLIIATIPLVIFTLIFEKTIEYVSSSLLFIGILLVINGLMLNIFESNNKLHNEINVKDAIVIGLFQSVGAFAGISRSGSCFCGGTVRGLAAAEKRRFVFLLFIPVMLGALVKTFWNFSPIYVTDITLYGLSFIIAAISTYCSLIIFKNIIEKGKIRYFGYYTFILGIIVIIWKI